MLLWYQTILTMRDQVNSRRYHERYIQSKVLLLCLLNVHREIIFVWCRCIFLKKFSSHYHIHCIWLGCLCIVCLFPVQPWKSISYTPLDDVAGALEVTSSETVASFSAVSYLTAIYTKLPLSMGEIPRWPDWKWLEWYIDNSMDGSTVMQQV